METGIPIRAAAPAADPGFRRELRGTLAVLVLVVGILAVGWMGAAVVGRERAFLAPGVTIVPSAGSQSRRGPTDFVSRTWRIGHAELSVAPTWEPATPSTLLDAYRREQIEELLPQPVIEPPEPYAHPAGDALRQRWTAGEGGDFYDGELLIVSRGPTAVILDARWPVSEDAAAIGEIRRMIESLRIEELAP
jgi:hypothetical protein